LKEVDLTGGDGGAYAFEGLAVGGEWLAWTIYGSNTSVGKVPK
jgi:hypothetical protein